MYLQPCGILDSVVFIERMDVRQKAKRVLISVANSFCFCYDRRRIYYFIIFVLPYLKENVLFLYGSSFRRKTEQNTRKITLLYIYQNTI